MAKNQTSTPEHTSNTPAKQQQSTTKQADQERSIETGHEGSRSSSLTRGTQSSPVRGPGTGTASSPFMLMRRMSEDMDRLFESFGFGRSFGGLSSRLSDDLWNDTWGTAQTSWMPAIETFRRGDKLVVRADLPGLRKEDVKVEMHDGLLTISGERNEEHEENRDDFYRSERSYGRFYRALELPDGVSADQCEASFKDGVLEVSLNAPKQQERQPKQIPVR